MYIYMVYLIYTICWFLLVFNLYLLILILQPMIFTSHMQLMIFTSHLTFIYHSYTLITDIRVKTSFGAYIINIRRDIYA